MGACRVAVLLLALLALPSAALAAGAPVAEEGDHCESAEHAAQDFEQSTDEAGDAEELNVMLLQTGLAHTARRPSTTVAPARKEQASQSPVPQANGLGAAPFLTLPPCKQHYWLSGLAEESRTWCDPRKVPPEQRAPDKLQGLFWLKGLPLPDVAACFSRGIWNKERRTLRLNVWSDFVFRDNTVSEAFESQIFKADMHYLVRFSDDGLSNATLHPEGSGLYLLGMKAFDVVSDFPMVELKTTKSLQAPGERWQRPSYFGFGSFKAKVSNYSMWRILDGRLKVITNNAHAMVRDLDPHGQGFHLSRFSADCLSPEACDRDTAGTCSAFRCHRWRGKVDCVNHGFLWHCICQEGYCAVNGRCVRVNGSDAHPHSSLELPS